MATIRNSLEKENISNKIYSCEYCEKTYKDRSGIWKHKKKCSSDPKNKIPKNIVGDKTIEDKLDTLFQMVHNIQKKQEQYGNLMDSTRERINLMEEGIALQVAQVEKTIIMTFDVLQEKILKSEN